MSQMYRQDQTRNPSHVCEGLCLQDIKRDQKSTEGNQRTRIGNDNYPGKGPQTVGGGQKDTEGVMVMMMMKMVMMMMMVMVMMMMMMVMMMMMMMMVMMMMVMVMMMMMMMMMMMVRFMMVDDDEEEDDDDSDDDKDEEEDEDGDGDDDMMKWMLRTRRTTMILRKENRSQDLETHFVRACAVEIHMSISQEPFCGNFIGKMAGDTSGDSVLCEPAQSKRTWTFEKSHFVWKFTRKCRTPIPGQAFCASLRNRTTHGHFTRAILL